MKNLLEKTREINELLQKTNTIQTDSELPYSDMAQVLSDVSDSDAYIIDKSGVLLGYFEKHGVNNDRVKKMLVDKRFPKKYTNAVTALSQTEVNIQIESDLTVYPVESRGNFPNGLTTIVPIYGAGERLGTIILGRAGEDFTDDDIVLAEYGATVVGMQILYQQSQLIEEEIRSSTAVQMAISSLSYSELKAVKAIFEALGGDEGRLTASNIADKIGITRSVIVNALRKLESAGVIEARSLGMKGTYIRILNPNFKEAINKENIF